MSKKQVFAEWNLKDCLPSLPLNGTTGPDFGHSGVQESLLTQVPQKSRLITILPITTITTIAVIGFLGSFR